MGCFDLTISIGFCKIAPEKVFERRVADNSAEIMFRRIKDGETVSFAKQLFVAILLLCTDAACVYCFWCTGWISVNLAVVGMGPMFIFAFIVGIGAELVFGALNIAAIYFLLVSTWRVLESGPDRKSYEAAVRGYWRCMLTFTAIVLYVSLSARVIASMADPVIAGKALWRTTSLILLIATIVVTWGIVSLKKKACGDAGAYGDKFIDLFAGYDPERVTKVVPLVAVVIAVVAAILFFYVFTCSVNEINGKFALPTDIWHLFQKGAKGFFNKIHR